MKEYREMTRDEWQKEGERRFGKDVEKWMVRCPMCGKVSSVSDFKDAGAKSPDCAFVECIGRYTGQGSPDKKTRKAGKGCNWCAYGLFGLPKDDRYVIVFDDGERKECFPFADPEEGRM